jgi:hypothetical protein
MRSLLNGGGAIEMDRPSSQAAGTSSIAGRCVRSCTLPVRRPEPLPMLFSLAFSRTTRPFNAIIIAVRAAVFFGRRGGARGTHIRGTRWALAAIPKSGGPHRLRYGVEGGL